MSGTSLDGVDAVLADFSQQPGTGTVRGHCSAPLPLALKEALLALNTPGDNELHRAALAANALVRIYAEQVHVLLQQCGVPPSSVRAIGAHGQTVRHRPQEFDGTGYTLLSTDLKELPARQRSVYNTIDYSRLNTIPDSRPMPQSPILISTSPSSHRWMVPVVLGQLVNHFPRI